MCSVEFPRVLYMYMIGQVTIIMIMTFLKRPDSVRFLTQDDKPFILMLLQNTFDSEEDHTSYID